ncbi:hypothetical protein [Hymenobacter chitinivorans]|uniref:Uncharacterized protein n=1 Tax=Hymenobacter chitinivorans DSM 11115 TaxID=1121954 RepID=A0A2M9AS69_9BACT|nr:hypothetical protein [Hymenobacter chitinivorans]PJJ48541.1 hypothetical protein CLV45_4250 [Hymenobacter chitinivorans DSM 11115]
MTAPDTPAPLPPNPPPDGWDKLNARIPILNSLAQFVLVTLLGFFAKCSVDDYTHNMERTKRVDELTAALASLDSGQDITKRNLALVTLDRLYSHARPGWQPAVLGSAENEADDSLMFNIAEEIYRARMATPVGPGDTAQVLARLNLAARIMGRRDPDRAAALLASFTAAAKERTRSSANADSSVTLAAALLPSLPIAPENRTLLDPSAAAPASAPAEDAAILTTPPTCYIQFREFPRATAQQLQQRFQQEGWEAPGVERVDGKYGNSVRYYFAADSATAAEVLRTTQAFLNTLPGTPRATLLSLTGRKLAGTVPPGQIEVWLSRGEKKSR